MMIRRTKARRSAFKVLLGISLLGSMALPWVVVAAGPAEVELELFNGIYTDLDTDLQPIQHGPLTIHVASPEHQLTVHRNLLSLQPSAEPGIFVATMEVEFEGRGHLTADVESVGTSFRFEDEVTVARQSVAVEGLARIERDAAGYLITVVDAPASVALEVRSGVMTRIIDACSALEKIIFFPVNCLALEQSLSSVAVPLPGPGAAFLLPDARLGEHERAFFARLDQLSSELGPDS